MSINKDIRPPKWLTHAMKEIGLEVIDGEPDSRTTERNDRILIFRIRNIPTSIQLEKLRKKLSNRGFSVETYHPVRDARPKVFRVQGWTMNNMMNRLESPVNFANPDARPEPERIGTNRMAKIMDKLKKDGLIK